MTPISAINFALDSWTIRARCVKKRPLNHYRNNYGPGTLSCFELEDDSARIRLTAFGDAADPVDEIVRLDATYEVDCCCANVRRANSRFCDFNHFEINITSAECIKEIPTIEDVKPWESLLNQTFMPVQVEELRQVPVKRELGEFQVPQTIGQTPASQILRQAQALQAQALQQIQEFQTPGNVANVKAEGTPIFIPLQSDGNSYTKISESASDSPSEPLAKTQESEVPFSLTLSRPPHRLGPFFATVAEIRELDAGARCDCQGAVTSKGRLVNSGGIPSLKITVTELLTSRPICVELCGEDAKFLNDQGMDRCPHIEILHAKVHFWLGDWGDRSQVVLKVDSDATALIRFENPAVSEKDASLSPTSVHELAKSLANLDASGEATKIDSETAHRYTVFISHASANKEKAAKPLHDYLKQRRIKSFLDSGRSRSGDQISDSRMAGMKHAMVGVFVLSPEFVASKWTMHELRCFMDRRREDMRKGRNPPEIVAFFHRWSVADCRNLAFFSIRGEDGEDVFRNEGFFSEERQKNFPVTDVSRYLTELADLMEVKITDTEHRRAWGARDRRMVGGLLDAVTEGLQNLIAEADKQ
ncbi:Protein containing a DNA replication factor 1domain, rfa like [Chondrus crispus]|uniref:Protein containing a DNA replication factor 1domain, rfa like n=1 Tax=Chondrus crispus TaxID=2769 RepID=R7QGI0_CHOCR|nr:Protein containing a DNA replication factor 1domain, rfa like [Chondrus crispus]CDF37627.1 Protein containing a DNA replication factor 1domain, rfa like [Chondrus crispus]|eukprot:XP_005717498.1 Protein containing a DNA replication factor 1domain, rfa like [Chondrus crispus]